MAILPEIYSPKIGKHEVIGKKYNEIKRERFRKSLQDFMMPSALGLTVGLRTGAQLLAGFESTRVAKFNIGQIDREIKQLGLRSELDMKQFDRAARQLEGQQKVAIASTGFATAGSMVDILSDTQAQIELERLSKRETQKAQFQAMRTQQELLRREAEQARLGSFISAGAELAGGIQNILEIL